MDEWIGWMQGKKNVRKESPVGARERETDKRESYGNDSAREIFGSEKKDIVGGGGGETGGRRKKKKII